MYPVEPTALAALEQSLGEAIELAKQARFGELTAKAEALESNAAALAGLDGTIARTGPEAKATRNACERVRRKIFVLAEIFKQTSIVQAGVLALHQTITTPYASSGRLPASRNPFAQSSRIDQEA